MVLASAALIIVSLSGMQTDAYNEYLRRAKSAKLSANYPMMVMALNDAHKVGQGDEYTWRSLSWALLKCRRWQDAMAAANENIKRNGATSWSLRQLFDVAIYCGDIELAKQTIKREASLPKEKRNTSMAEDIKTLAKWTSASAYELFFTIDVSKYKKQKGKLYIQTPLSGHSWQHCSSNVIGAKDWEAKHNGRWDYVVIDPGKAKTVKIHCLVTHKPRPIGHIKIRSATRAELPSGFEDLQKKYTTKFVNGTKYDPKNPVIEDWAMMVQGKSIADTVQKTMDHIASYMTYEEGYPDTLESMVKYRKGVCHHYANLMVSMCRANKIPALVAHGIGLPTEGEFKNFLASHGWVEVFVPEFGWTPVDPLHNQTFMAFPGTGYLIVDVSGLSPTDDHFNMKLKNGIRLQSIQSAPVSGKVWRIKA